jgi:hypothetical protein
MVDLCESRVQLSAHDEPKRRGKSDFICPRARLRDTNAGRSRPVITTCVCTVDPMILQVLTAQNDFNDFVICDRFVT